MKKFLQILFSCILALFLSILCLAAGLCHYAQKTICNSNYLLNASKESNYSQVLYEEIAYEWENLLAITGVETPEDIMAVLTPEIVERDAHGYFTDAYTGSAPLDTQQLRTDLDVKIREYAYSHNIYATPEAELEQNITDLVDACMVEYEGAITIPLLPKILGTVSKFAPLLNTGLILLAAACTVLLIFIFFMQRKKQDTLYYLLISIATSSLILLAIPLIAKYYNIINRVPFGDSALKSLVMRYLQNLLGTMSQYGKLLLIVAITIFILYLIICLIITLVRLLPKKGQEAEEAQ